MVCDRESVADEFVVRNRVDSYSITITIPEGVYVRAYNSHIHIGANLYEVPIPEDLDSVTVRLDWYRGDMDEYLVGPGLRAIRIPYEDFDDLIYDDDDVINGYLSIDLLYTYSEIGEDQVTFDFNGDLIVMSQVDRGYTTAMTYSYVRSIHGYNGQFSPVCVYAIPRTMNPVRTMKVLMTNGDLVTCSYQIPTTEDGGEVECTYSKHIELQDINTVSGMGYVFGSFTIVHDGVADVFDGLVKHKIRTAKGVYQLSLCSDPVRQSLANRRTKRAVR